MNQLKFNFYDLSGYLLPGALAVLLVPIPWIVKLVKLGSAANASTAAGVAFAAALVAYFVGFMLAEYYRPLFSSKVELTRQGLVGRSFHKVKSKLNALVYEPAPEPEVTPDQREVTPDQSRKKPGRIATLIGYWQSLFPEFALPFDAALHSTDNAGPKNGISCDLPAKIVSDYWTSKKVVKSGSSTSLFKLSRALLIQRGIAGYPEQFQALQAFSRGTGAAILMALFVHVACLARFAVLSSPAQVSITWSANLLSGLVAESYTRTALQGLVLYLLAPALQSLVVLYIARGFSAIPLWEGRRVFFGSLAGSILVAATPAPTTSSSILAVVCTLMLASLIQAFRSHARFAKTLANSVLLHTAVAILEDGKPTAAGQAP